MTHSNLMNHIEILLVTGSEYTYKFIIGYRRGGMLIITGLEWESSYAQPIRIFRVG